jgi:uncharacterized protein (TIGR02147 family)
MSLVMKGERDFSPEQAFTLAEHLQLSEPESDYLSLLVQYGRAGTWPYKKHLKRKIEKNQADSRKISRRFAHEKKLSAQEQSVFYSSWVYSAVRLYCSTREGGRTPEEIGKKFDLPRKKVLDALEFLAGAGLVESADGRFRMGTQRTFLEFGSPHLLKHHSNWRIKALQRSDTLGEEEMMFTSPMSLSRADFHRIRELLADTLKQISPIVKDSPAEEVACLNVDFYRVQP